MMTIFVIKHVRTRFTLSKALLALCAVIAAADARASVATNITGLYYTGETSSGSLQSTAGSDAHWVVTYASTNGGSNSASDNNGTISGNNGDKSYVGSGLVINSSTFSGSSYVQNTSQAQWITAPGATDANGNNVNTGNDYLPGNGNSGGNEGIYIYTLAFQIIGTGTGAVTSQIQISMTIAADDQYAVYVNPTGNGTSLPTGTAAATGYSAWTNTTQIDLQNYGTGTADNSAFVIGTNYISIVVDNTNSLTGSSTATQINASGLLVYQTSAATINGTPVPEVATWLPVLGAIGLYGFLIYRRRNPSISLAESSLA